MWDNTRTIYQRLIKEHPTLAYQFLELVKATYMDCKNHIALSLTDMEPEIRNLGKEYDKDEQNIN